MKTSTVIEISADNANSVKPIDDNHKEATISHTPNTKVQPPITIKKAPKIILKGKGKEKTVLSQKLPQKPSRVVVDVKEKKDKNNPYGKKKWETDLVVEGKAKKVPHETDTIQTSETEENSSSENITDIESTKMRTEEIIDVPEAKEEVVDVETVTEISEEVLELGKTTKPKVIEVIKTATSGDEGNEVVEDVAELPPSQAPEIITVRTSKSKNDGRVIEKIVEASQAIDIENLGNTNKVVTALKENRHEILGDLRGGLTPDLIRWAEEAIAAGIDNVVNAVEDKYIDYMKSRARRKRAAPSTNPDDEGDGDDDERDDDDSDDDVAQASSKTLQAAMKKVQKAAAVLATSEAQNAAKAASTAAKLNMDVTSQAASNAMKSVASAIGAASQNAAKQIVDAENKAAAAALAGTAPVIAAGAAPQAPVIVSDAAPAPADVEEAVAEAAARAAPISITDGPAASAAAIEQAAAAAAGGSAGRDLIQQTLQIQKGLNLVMRAVLKEKERVAADLARYQNKISFLLREMAGAPVEMSAGGTGRRRRREVRRQRRALLTTQHLRQLLQREETRVNQMLHMLDSSITAGKRKRAAGERGTCRGSPKRRAGRKEANCGDVG